MEFKRENGRIYLQDASGKLLAEITYVPVNEEEMSINHTFVDDSLRGQGIASRLVEAAVEDIRGQGKSVSATCSYAAGWLKKHFAQ